VLVDGAPPVLRPPVLSNLCGVRRVELDEKAGKLEHVEWYKDGTGFRADCPLSSNGTTHRIAVSKARTSCLHIPCCSKELIEKFFANGVVGRSNGTSHSTDVTPSEPTERKPNDDFTWKYKLSFVAKNTLTDPKLSRYVATESRENLHSGLLATLREACEKIDTAPPPDMNPVEVEEDLDALTRDCLAQYLPELPTVRDGGELAELPEASTQLKMLDLGQLYDLVDEWDRQPWVWEGILPRASLSLIVGKSETGKSTLLYRLIYCIIRGLDFFGRKCEQGRVLYLAGDPISEVVAGKTFRDMGLARTDALRVVPGALVGSPTGMKDLRGWVADLRPTLVVGDTLAATVQIDTDKYGQSYQVQQPLTQIAREFSPNFLMSHHSQKSAIDTYSVIDSALGSVGVAAVASSRMATRLHRRNGQNYYTFEMSNLRLGTPIEGEWIVNKAENGMMDLDVLWASRSQNLDKEVLLKTLEKRTVEHPMAERTLWQQTYPKPKWGPFKEALEELVNTKQVRRSAGKRGGQLYQLERYAPPEENKLL
jgi:hypothetical protein